MRRTASNSTDGQLVAGQWAQIELGGASDGGCLRGFVFGLRAAEILFTFPNIEAPPAGLVPGAEAVVRYTSLLGQHSGRSSVLRVAVGPPLTVAFERLDRIATAQRRHFPRAPVRLALGLVVVASSVLPVGREDRRARTRSLATGGLLVETVVPLQPGDLVRLTFNLPGRLREGIGPTCEAMARVVRAGEVIYGRRRVWRVGLEFIVETEAERNCLERLAQAVQRRTR